MVPKIALIMYFGVLYFQSSSDFWLGGAPASQPHTPPELCLCFAFKAAACSEAAFCRWRSSSSFCNVSIVCSFCRSSATSTWKLKAIRVVIYLFCTATNFFIFDMAFGSLFHVDSATASELKIISRRWKRNYLYPSDFRLKIIKLWKQAKVF